MVLLKLDGVLATLGHKSERVLGRRQIQGVSQAEDLPQVAIFSSIE